MAVDASFADRIRRSADRAEDGRYSEVVWSRYPFGFCRHIRDAVFDRLLEDSYFQALIKKGLTLKPVFIFLRESYFQNAIQLGNY